MNATNKRNTLAILGLREYVFWPLMRCMKGQNGHNRGGILLAKTLGIILFLVLIHLPASGGPSLTNVTLLPGRHFQVQAVVEVGKSYTLELSTNLVQWEAVDGIYNAPTSLLTFTDERTVDQEPRQFFRLREGAFERLEFKLIHFIEGGSISGTTVVPTTSYPIFFQSYSAMLNAEHPAPWPPLNEVLFTGPSGSGLVSSPAAYGDVREPDGAGYQSLGVTSSMGAPAGTWTVRYRGSNMVYQTTLDPLTRLVLPVPSLVVANGYLTRVNWVFRDRVSGQVLPQSPAYIAEMQVQLEGRTGRLYSSEEEDVVGTGRDIPYPILWADVTTLNLAYDDIDNNHYVIFYRGQ